MRGTAQLDLYPRYAPDGPSSRLRFYAYGDYWAKHTSWRVDFHPFFPEGYVRDLYAGRGKSLPALLRGMASRWRGCGADTPAFIEYEWMPFLPFFLENAVLKRRPFVLNFDDNVWEKYRRLPFLRNKFDGLVRHARGVVCANDFLMERMAPLQKNLLKLPTPVIEDRYQPGPKAGHFTLAWIGTPVTYRYLEAFADALREMASQVPLTLLVIARKELSARAIPGVPMVFEDWSEEREGELLGRAHAGIMPLTNDAFARGKSAYKLLQYQMAGLPQIASDVGENCKVVRHGETGFFCSTPGQWAAAAKMLYEDASLRERMGEASRKAAAPCSLAATAPVLTDFLRKSLGLP